MELPSRQLLRAVGPPFAGLVAVTSGLGLGGLAGAELLRAPVLPGGRELLLAVAALLPSVLEVSLPVSALLAMAVAGARWRAEGDWLALMASGVPGRSLLGGVLVAAALLASSAALLAHGPAPAGRTQAAALLLRSPRPVAGRPVALGPLTLLACRASGTELADVFFSVERSGADPVVGAARTGSVGAAGLELRDGELHLPGEPELRVRFQGLHLPLPEARPAPLADMDDGSLWARAGRGGAEGARARNLLLKRSTVPLAEALLLVLALPLVLGRRAWTVGPAWLGWWVGVRACDHLAARMGGELAAWLPTGLVALGAAIAWSLWKER